MERLLSDMEVKHEIRETDVNRDAQQLKHTCNIGGHVTQQHYKVSPYNRDSVVSYFHFSVGNHLVVVRELASCTTQCWHLVKIHSTEVRPTVFATMHVCLRAKDEASPMLCRTRWVCTSLVYQTLASNWEQSTRKGEKRWKMLEKATKNANFEIFWRIVIFRRKTVTFHQFLFTYFLY